jgi:hypothetical protein
MHENNPTAMSLMQYARTQPHMDPTQSAPPERVTAGQPRTMKRSLFFVSYDSIFLVSLVGLHPEQGASTSMATIIRPLPHTLARALIGNDLRTLIGAAPR